MMLLELGPRDSARFPQSGSRFTAVGTVGIRECMLRYEFLILLDVDREAFEHNP